MQQFGVLLGYHLKNRLLLLYHVFKKLLFMEVMPTCRSKTIIYGSNAYLSFKNYYYPSK
jgi:hypothetical protein